MTWSFITVVIIILTIILVGLFLLHDAKDIRQSLGKKRASKQYRPQINVIIKSTSLGKTIELIESMQIVRPATKYIVISNSTSDIKKLRYYKAKHQLNISVVKHKKPQTIQFLASRYTRSGLIMVIPDEVLPLENLSKIMIEPLADPRLDALLTRPVLALDQTLTVASLANNLTSDLYARSLSSPAVGTEDLTDFLVIKRSSVLGDVPTKISWAVGSAFLSTKMSISGMALFLQLAILAIMVGIVLITPFSDRYVAIASLLAINLAYVGLAISRFGAYDIKDKINLLMLSPLSPIILLYQLIVGNIYGLFERPQKLSKAR